MLRSLRALFLCALSGVGCTALLPAATCVDDDDCATGRCVEDRCADDVGAATRFGADGAKGRPPTDEDPDPAGASDAGVRRTTDAGTPADAGDADDDGGGDGGDVGEPPSPVDAGDEPPTPSCGSTFPADVFTFVPVADTRCLFDGSSGFAVRPRANAQGVLVRFLEAQACLDGASCPPQASHDGYGEDELATDLLRVDGMGALDRDDPENPFADFHVVLIPDCTADLHLGLREHDDGRRHVGADNVLAIVPHVAAAFDCVEQVAVAGTNGAGFAALAHGASFSAAMPDAQIDVVVDQWPLLSSSHVGTQRYEQADEAWGVSMLAPSTSVSGGWDDWWAGFVSDFPLRTTLIVDEAPYWACAMQGAAQFDACDAAVCDAVIDVLGVPHAAVFYVENARTAAFLSRPFGATRDVHDAALGPWLGARLATPWAPY